MKIYSIRTKISLIVASAIFIGIAVLVTVSSISTYKNTLEAARREGLAVVKENASKIVAKLEVGLDEARALAKAYSALNENPEASKLDRKSSEAILKKMVKSDASYLGVYTCWEPNAYDGLDEEYASKPGHDESGRFIPYWTKSGLEPLVNYDVSGAGDYYQIPKRTGKEAILDPYLYSVGGKETLLTSLVVPVRSNGTFLGITGIDFSAAFIQELAENANIFNGYAGVQIISNNGVIVGDSQNPERVGQNFQEFVENYQEQVSDIKRGSQRVWETDGGAIGNIIVPIEVGSTGTPWQFRITVPVNVLMGNLKELILKQIGLGLLCLVVFISVLVVILSRAINPLIDLAGISEEIAQGDLTKEIDIKRNDEIGKLALSFNNMVSRLKDVVVGISNSSGNIASASQQLSSSSQVLSQGASEQASSAEEISASIEEMSANIQQNTENSQQTEKISLEASQKINDVSSKAFDALNANKEIAEKITIITEIAFQTNILALNAAVEAARAGEHGKGFAVVAAEVRKLAERSKVAAEEIVNLVGSGVDLAQDAGKVMMETLPQIDNTAKLVKEISAASMEQNSGAKQINNAIQQLNQITQQNAAASEEMATSSEELSSQAEQLNELISFFNIGGINLKKNSRRNKSKNLNEFTLDDKEKYNLPERLGVKIDMSSKEKDSGYEKF